MAALRRYNAIGQQRFDVPHLRLVEEAVAGDFDALAGKMLAGGAPAVLRGFTLNTAGVTQAARLTMRVADGLLIHPLASDAGSIYAAPADEPDELLGPTNAHVVGAFAPSQANYVGVDLVLQADDATTDQVMILSTATFRDGPRRIPLGRTMQRRIVISTVDPSASPNVAPIAKVVTDAANNLVSVTDIRNRMFRLGTGGAVPDPLHAFPWTAGRSDTTSFTESGDKQIGTLVDWARALMTRTWELGGGERWFSPTADRNVTVVGLGATFGSSGDYLEWTGTNVHWQGLAVLFDNSTGRINEIADQTGNTTGLTDLADGECVFVDVDRAQDRTGGAALVAGKAPLTQLGLPVVPGSRLVFAWRRGAQVYYRGKLGPIGATALAAATTAILGGVVLSGTPPVPAAPVAVTATAAGRAMATGVTRAGSIFGAGGIAIGPDVTADTGVTYGNVSMAGGHIFDGASAGAEVVLVRNRTDRAITPGTKLATWQQNDGGVLKEVFRLDGSGTLALKAQLAVPSTPPAGEVKVGVRSNGLSTPFTRTQFYVMFDDGVAVVVAEGPAS